MDLQIFQIYQHFVVTPQIDTSYSLQQRKSPASNLSIIPAFLITHIVSIRFLSLLQILRTSSVRMILRIDGVSLSVTAKGTRGISLALDHPLQNNY